VREFEPTEAFCPWNDLFFHGTSAYVNSAGDLERFKHVVGERIRGRRKELGLTQEDLAGLAEIDRKHVSSIETGKAEPGIWTLIRIAGALRMPVSALVRDLTSVPNEHGLGQLEQRDL
jgi:DNA-binding XRE family transcriptional regulator